jgi:tetratricopeptide (TPR) repeat protein
MLRKKTFLIPAYYVAMFTGLAMYVAVVSNQYYNITNSRDSFGLGVPCNMHPQGVAQYIEQKGLQNKKCFSDYLTSSYLMWRLQANFKTYIDLRDLDVFTSDFFNDYLRTVNDYKYFLHIDSFQHFDYVVLQRTQHDVLHAYLYNDSIYACTYVDQVAAVYEKTDAFSRADIFNYCTDVKQNGLSKFINHTLNPLYSNYNFRNSNAELIAAEYYTNVGRTDLAEQRIQKALINYPDEKDKTQCALGNLFTKRSIFTKDTKEKSDFLLQAAGAYNGALQFNNKNFEAMLGLGTSQFYLQNYNDALITFGKAIAHKSDDANAISNAIECCRAIADKYPDRKIEIQNLELKYCKMAYNNESQNPVNIMNLGFALYKTGDITAAKKYLSSIQNNEMLSEDNRREVNRLLGY